MGPLCSLQLWGCGSLKVCIFINSSTSRLSRGTRETCSTSAQPVSMLFIWVTVVINELIIALIYTTRYKEKDNETEIWKFLSCNMRGITYLSL